LYYIRPKRHIMSNTKSKPTPPDSLPKYIVEGVSKQDTPALKDLKTYVENVIEYREQTVPQAELPDDAEPVTGDSDGDGHGTIVKERVTCGDESCHCMKPGGSKHGPYMYRYYYADGKLKSEYVGKPGDE
jgi:hypothetical protein